MMVMPAASVPGPQRLHLGGGESKDKLMVGGLVLIIVVAAAALVFSIAGGGAKRPGGNEMTFVCAAGDCGYTWTMDLEQRRASMAHNPDRPVGDELPRFPCPKCHKNSGFHAAVCPACGEAFLPNSVRQMLGMKVQWPQKCPKCGTDTQQWYKDHPEKK